MSVRPRLPLPENGGPPRHSVSSVEPSVRIMTPNKHMLRAVTHKVLGRGRSGLRLSHFLSARVLIRQRAGADVGRYTHEGFL